MQNTGGERPTLEYGLADRTPKAFVDAFVDVVSAREKWAADLLQIALHSDPMVHYGLPLDVMLMHSIDQHLVEVLLRHPIEMLPLLEDALRITQAALLTEHRTLTAAARDRCGGESGEQGNEAESWSVKNNIHPRLHSLPLVQQHTKATLGDIRAADAGHLVAIAGTVVRTGGVKMVEAAKEYQCTACNHVWTLYSDIEQRGVITPPKQCPNPLTATGRPRKTPCKGRSFVYVEGSHVCRDYQEIKLQEQAHRMGVGSIPRTIVCALQDDLVEQVQAGDEVTVTGIVRLMWRNRGFPGSICDVSLFVEALHLRPRHPQAGAALGNRAPQLLGQFDKFWLHYGSRGNGKGPGAEARAEGRPLLARNLIVSSVCPQLCGLFMAKLAVLLTVLGGTGQADEMGLSVRGESHLLIVGDPGTGKSQLLKFASQLMDRSVLTTGAGTTGAGLTVAAQRDASTGEWGLEAGALVLADGGICCIDEFACVRPADRATIHEAMEQQTLSVAKAGLVTQLNTRCSVFAILNPKQGEYDDMLDLSANTGIGTALLSRFDVILLMLDQRDKHWDRRVTQHIMQALPSAEPNAAKVGQAEQAEPAVIPGGKGEEVRAGSTGKAGKDKKSGLPSGPYGPCWPLDRLKAYIAHARAALKPRMTANAKTLLLRYYHRQRGAGGGEVAGGGRAASRTTVRLLESLVRLAQAHARLMWRGRVTTQDAVVAVLVTEGSVGSSTLSSGWFAMHGGAAKAMGIPFDAAPDAVYAQQQAEVLRFLGLSGNHQWTDTYDYPAELTARPSPQPPSLTSATSPTPALPGAHLPGQPIAPALPSPSSAPPCPLLLEHVVAAAPFNAHSAPLPTPPSASYDLPAVPAFAPIAAPSSRSIALPASVPFNRAPPRRMPAAPVVHSAIPPAISPITTAGPATPFARASADVLVPPAAIPPHRNHNQSSQSRVSHTQSSQGHSNVLGDDGVLGGDVDDLDLDL